MLFNTSGWITMGRINSRIDLSYLRKLVTWLKDKDCSSSIDALSTGAGLTTKTVERLLNEHQNYIVKVGDRDLYTLNRFSPFRGDVNAMLEMIDESEGQIDPQIDWKRGFQFGFFVGLSLGSFFYFISILFQLR